MKNNIVFSSGMLNTEYITTILMVTYNISKSKYIVATSVANNTRTLKKSLFDKIRICDILCSPALICEITSACEYV